MFTETPEAQAIIAWHDSQTEEFLASLPGYEDGLTPRQAWEAFCSLPATKQPGEGLAAPADAGQGAGTLPPLVLLPVQRLNPYQRWQQVCAGAVNSTFLPRVVQARALVHPSYLAVSA